MSRRRWFVVGAVAVAALAALVFVSLVSRTVTHEAVARLRIRGSGTNQERDDSFRRTQIELLQSPVVLRAALRRPGIADLATIVEAADPVGWFAESMRVATDGEPEVIRISLVGPRPDDLRQLVDAVTATYLDDIVAQDRTDRAGRLELLKLKLQETERELDARRRTLEGLQEGEGGPEIDQRRADVESLEQLAEKLGHQMASLSSDLLAPPPADLLEGATVAIKR